MKPARILVVEDNPVTRKMIRVTLEQEGFNVVEAPDARTALQRVEEKKVDLVLQDLRLTDMDGLELCRRIRALPEARGIRIIALSGLLPKVEQARRLDPGFNEFILKPIEPSHLLEKIRPHLPP